MTDPQKRAEPVRVVDSLKEAAPLLRRPFHPNAIKFKVQSQWPKNKTPTGALMVAYIDARLVSERLNAICPHLWQTKFEHYGDRIDTKKMICHLTIDGMTRTDVGSSQGQTEEVQIKAGYSDAFKRAAVHFGVGVSLYALPQWKLNAKRGAGFETVGDGEQQHERPILSVTVKDKVEVTPNVTRYLRQMYANWLKEVGEDRFGKALDHGDVEDSVGDPTEQAAPPGEEAVQEDLELAAKREEIEKVYSNGTDKRKFPKGKFEARLREADTAEKLDQLKADVEKATSDA